MSNAIPVMTGSDIAALSTTKTIRNAYLLLTMILGLSAVTAWYAISSNAQPVNVWLFLAFMIGMASVASLRLASLHYGWQLPVPQLGG